MRVTLSPRQVELAKDTGVARWKVHSGKHQNHQVVPDRDGADLYVIGAECEFAVCLALGLPLPTVVCDGSDGGIGDLEYKGLPVQVKGTIYPRGRLAFFRHSAFRAPVAVLAIRTRRGVVDLPGWCTRKDFVEKSIIETLTATQGPQPVMYQNQLRPLSTLSDYADSLLEPANAPR